MTVQDILGAVNAAAPFETQEKWDNSGLLVGSLWQEVEHVMVTLDISSEAVDEAVGRGCDLIVSHHPVIFSALRNVSVENPVYQLAANGLAAICCHTPLDIAQGGINDILVDMLRAPLGLMNDVFPLEESGCGRIVSLRRARSAEEIAVIAKDVLGAQVVRYYDAGISIEKLGICSGSGASMLEEAYDRCDALLTGDVKHDRWYAAQDLQMSLFDCGHYHTEVVMIPYLAKRLRERFPHLKVTEWEGGDPVRYV